MKKHNIVVYGRADCIYCDKAKKYIDDLGLEFAYIDITYWPKEEREKLKSKYNVKTVPIIILDTVCIGGYDNLVQKLYLL